MTVGGQIQCDARLVMNRHSDIKAPDSSDFVGEQGKGVKLGDIPNGKIECHINSCCPSCGKLQNLPAHACRSPRMAQGYNLSWSS